MQFPSLHTLALLRCPMTSKSIDLLTGLELTSIELTDCNITDEGLSCLSVACPLLQTLSLGHNPQLTDVAIGQLRKLFPSLHTLSMQYSPMPNNRIRILKTLNLVSLDLSYCQVEKHSCFDPIKSLMFYKDPKKDPKNLNLKNLNLSGLSPNDCLLMQKRAQLRDFAITKEVKLIL